MRIAVLTDLHANVYALRAVLRDLRSLAPDVIIHTGDAIDLGPCPAATLELLAENSVVSVLGNHDAALTLGVPPNLPPAETDHYHWTHSKLSAVHRLFVASWPWQVDLVFPGLNCRFLHYALPRPPHRHANPFLDPPAAQLASNLDVLFPSPIGNGPNLMFHGHSHTPTDLAGASRYLSSGPTGLGGTGQAPFFLLTLRPSGYDLESLVASYDSAPLRRDFFASPIPDRDNILNWFHAGLVATRT